MALFRKPESVDITPMAYSRWLRACRPPLDQFMAMDEDSQECLAAIGDEHTQDVIEGLAAAITHPEALLAGSEAPEPPAESALAVAQSVAQKLSLGGSGGSRHVRPQSERPIGTLFGAKGETSR